MAIVGGGYIGLEAAAVLSKLGKEVVLLEALDRRARPRRRRAAVALLRGRASRPRRRHPPRTPAGETASPADLDRSSRIGIDAAVGPLLAAGAAGGNGVDVDEYCRTSLPDIYAVGDCAAHANRFAGGARIRLESVQNAHDQATVAAKAIAGRARAL